jgi:hypothetical protein
MRLRSCTEASIINYQSTLRKILEERRSQLDLTLNLESDYCRLVHNSFPYRLDSKISYIKLDLFVLLCGYCIWFLALREVLACLLT